MSLTPRSYQSLARHSEVQPHASRAAALISSGDRVATALGPREHWPQPLTTLVEVMLGSNQPMFVAWGPERTLLYNDPYAEILAAKHPDAMGQPLLDVWAEIRDDIEPIVELTYQGEPVRMDDIALVMHRRGYPEETHFAFSYTPVRDQMGEVAGLFCTCIETTEQVSSGRKLRESEARFRAVQETSIDGFMVLESVRDEAGVDSLIFAGPMPTLLPSASSASHPVGSSGGACLKKCPATVTTACMTPMCAWSRRASRGLRNSPTRTRMSPSIFA